MSLLVVFASLLSLTSIALAQPSQEESVPEAKVAIEPTGGPDPEPELDELIASIDAKAGDPGSPTFASNSTNPPFPTGGGTAPTRLLRGAPSAYADGASALAGADRRGPREISNAVLVQSQPIFSGKGASDMMWQWGQFVDHDVDLTETHHPDEPAPIAVPLGDPFFDPTGQGNKIIPFSRSFYDTTTGTYPGNPRQQVNMISAFQDATNVYGEDPARTEALRTLDGTGRLKTSNGNFLPFNTQGFPNAQPPGTDPAGFFLAGDIRANEQVGLSAMHTLWVREHNTIAQRLRAANPYLGGDAIFDIARRIVISEMQVITYREFLPVLLGQGALAPYTGYNPNVDPGVLNGFSTAAYRLGHTMLSSTILRLTPQGFPIPEGHLPLRDAFFTPWTLIDEGGLEPVMKGLASQVMQAIDVHLVDDVRNFLFGHPEAGGLDLASLNIQRGRDHGLPDYNTFRIYFGLTPVSSFAEISSDPVVQERLADIYKSVDDIDVWVGALAEDPFVDNSASEETVFGQSLVGELLFAMLKDQFERIRDGDPNWYQNIFSPHLQELLEKQTLAKVIARNTNLRRKNLQPNVFIVP